jgi:predicted transcriptional regulator
MASPKRTPTQRENDLERIAAMYLRGNRQADIAAELGIAQQQVSYDLKEIHKRWRESTLVSINEVKHRELSRIDELERTYWDAWQRSIGEKTKTRTEKAVDGVSKASIEKESLVGNPAFLNGVLSCIEQRCKIFGIYEATKIAITDWRKAVEDQGHDTGRIFEEMVNAYIAAVDQAANGEDAG